MKPEFLPLLLFCAALVGIGVANPDFAFRGGRAMLFQRLLGGGADPEGLAKGRQRLRVVYALVGVWAAATVLGWLPVPW